ncbi:MAG: hypothetical protein Q7R93_02130 [bacterium]|nr:hypothetical protein [bacterium]
MNAKTIGLFKEVARGNIGLLSGLLTAEGELGSDAVLRFLDTVPERGSVLYDRFVLFQVGREADGKKAPGFPDFIKSVLPPNFSMT